MHDCTLTLHFRLGDYDSKHFQALLCARLNCKKKKSTRLYYIPTPNLFFSVTDNTIYNSISAVKAAHRNNYIGDCELQNWQSRFYSAHIYTEIIEQLCRITVNVGSNKQSNFSNSLYPPRPHPHPTYTHKKETNMIVLSNYQISVEQSVSRQGLQNMAACWTTSATSFSSTLSVSWL